MNKLIRDSCSFKAWFTAASSPERTVDVSTTSLYTSKEGIFCSQLITPMNIFINSDFTMTFGRRWTRVCNGRERVLDHGMQNQWTKSGSKGLVFKDTVPENDSKNCFQTANEWTLIDQFFFANAAIIFEDHLALSKLSNLEEIKSLNIITTVPALENHICSLRKCRPIARRCRFQETDQFINSWIQALWFFELNKNFATNELTT